MFESGTLVETGVTMTDSLGFVHTVATTSITINNPTAVDMEVFWAHFGGSALFTGVPFATVVEGVMLRRINGGAVLPSGNPIEIGVPNFTGGSATTRHREAFPTIPVVDALPGSGSLTIEIWKTYTVTATAGGGGTFTMANSGTQVARGVAVQT